MLKRLLVICFSGFLLTACTSLQDFFEDSGDLRDRAREGLGQVFDHRFDLREQAFGARVFQIELLKAQGVLALQNGEVEESMSYFDKAEQLFQTYYEKVKLSNLAREFREAIRALRGADELEEELEE